jgi:uncharacterized protein YggU (UPF0235/DUF167 family)
VRSYLEDCGTALRLRIRLTPNARTEGFGGTFEDAEGKTWLKASVRAVPEDGKANDALVRILAKRTGIAKSRWQLVQGHTSRMKILEAGDASSEAVLALEALGNAH